MKRKIKQVILSYLQKEPVRLFLFGSRAQKNANPNSDYDIGYIPSTGFHYNQITRLKEHLESSNIPYKIDLVDFSKCDPIFKKEALKTTEIWKA